MTRSRWIAGKGARAGLALACAFWLGGSVGCTRTVPTAALPGDLVELEVKGKRVSAEVASDQLSRQLGLMDRPSLPENSGMLFIFRESDKLGFWMKNTLIPLSIAYIDDNGKILQIEDMKPKDESSTRSKYVVRYALEVNQGWFQKNGVGVGDSFREFPEKVRPFRGS